ncbi:hypothetical protein IG631_23347 [Alternaria alternata]|nr:hypothetical protein IG631_23347 [Alternaria alternata]
MCDVAPQLRFAEVLEEAHFRAAMSVQDGPLDLSSPRRLEGVQLSWSQQRYHSTAG